MQLICHMIQRAFLAASTPSSWLFLDYRFVCFSLFVLCLSSVHVPDVSSDNIRSKQKTFCVYYCPQAGKIILHYRELHKSILSRFLIWGLSLVSSCTCCITSRFSLSVGEFLFTYLFPLLHSWVSNKVSCNTQGIISAVLTKCSKDQGVIPVNKNLWWPLFIYLFL